MYLVYYILGLIAVVANYIIYYYKTIFRLDSYYNIRGIASDLE